MSRRPIYLFVVATLLSLYTSAQTAKTLWKHPFDPDFFCVLKTGFSTDSRYYAIGNNRGVVTIYGAEWGGVYHTYTHKSRVFCALFQPGGDLMASGDKDGVVKIYDYVKHEEKRTIEAHAQAIMGMCFSKDGKLLVTGSRDNSAKVWDVETGKLLHEISDIKGNVIGVRITPDNKTLIVATRALSYGVRTYDLTNGSEIRKLAAANVESIDLSPDGKQLAVANLDKKITVWNVAQGTKAYTLTGHDKHPSDVAFNAAGDMLISSGDDNMVLLWNVATKKRVAILEGRKDMAGVAWSPNGKFVAVMCDDSSLTMLDVSDVKP